MSSSFIATMFQSVTANILANVKAPGDQKPKFEALSAPLHVSHSLPYFKARLVSSYTRALSVLVEQGTGKSWTIQSYGKHRERTLSPKDIFTEAELP